MCTIRKRAVCASLATVFGFGLVKRWDKITLLAFRTISSLGESIEKIGQNEFNQGITWMLFSGLGALALITFYHYFPGGTPREEPLNEIIIED